MKKECDFCGAENEDWMKICINCGHQLKENKEEIKEAKIEKVEKTSKSNPNGTLMLVFGVLVAIFILLLILVISMFT